MAIARKDASKAGERNIANKVGERKVGESNNAMKLNMKETNMNMVNIKSVTYYYYELALSTHQVGSGMPYLISKSKSLLGDEDQLDLSDSPLTQGCLPDKTARHA